MANEKKSKSSGNAKIRMIVVAVAVVVVAIAAGVIWHHHREVSEAQGTASVTGAPTVQTLPGTGNPSNQYVKSQNLQNNRQALQARKKATSDVPTLVRPSFIGNPSMFANGNNPHSCPINKVVVMYKPNPASCSLPNLELARKAGVTAEELRCQACSCPMLKLAGYTAGELKNTGYTAADLHKCGFTLAQLVQAGFSAADLKAAGFTAKQLRNVGFSAAQLKAAGFSAAQLKKAGFSAAQLKKAGFNAKQMQAAGYTAAQLKNAGYSATQLKNAGFTNAALKAAGFSAAQIKTADAVSKVCNVTQLRKERLAGMSAAQLKNQGCGLAALKAAGFTAAQLKNAGFSAAQLKAAGFTAAQLKHAGFSAAQLKNAGFSAKALKGAGFGAAALKTAGFSAGQLKNAGFSAADLNHAGFSAKQLRAAGYTAAQLKSAGFTPKQLLSAGFTKGDLLRAGFSPKQAGYVSEKTAAKNNHPSMAALLAAKRAQQQDQAVNSANAFPSIGSNSPESRLDKFEQMQQAQLNAQQRADQIQQQEGAMTLQAQKMLAAWSNSSQQNYQAELPPQVVATKGSVSASGSANAGGPIFKAGTVMFAVLDTSIDSDENTPIMATIVQGKLKGTKLLGKFERVNKKVYLQFDVANVPGYDKTMSIDAVAIDPDTARTAISGQVNNHYLLRYGTLFASAFVSGLSDSLLSAHSTTYPTLLGPVQIQQPLNTTQSAIVALGNVGKQYADVMGNNFNTPPTVKVQSGSGMGILLMKDLELPLKQPTLNQ